ncbi:MAG: hypothetical protein L3J96_02580, partial [Thermoplasmata archaeon]|nr:hypothetical protein [Thermoplasmata archaeon]
MEPRASYAEVMAEAGRGARFRLDKASLNPEAMPRLQGAVFRAWNGKSWVETVARDLSRAGLLDAAQELSAQLPAEALGKAPPGRSETGRGEMTTPCQRPLDDVTFDGMRELARTFYSWATAVKGIENAVVGLSHLTNERLFLSTAGASRYQKVSRVHTAVTPLAISGGKVEYDFVSIGETGGAEVWDKMNEPLVTQAAREALALLSARSAPSGKMAVLLDPSTAGTFAHESFGHGTESDQLLRD